MPTELAAILAIMSLSTFQTAVIITNNYVIICFITYYMVMGFPSERKTGILSIEINVYFTE
jgi:hypothetical protein